jgi:hypothetical protein
MRPTRFGGQVGNKPVWRQSTHCGRVRTPGPVSTCLHLVEHAALCLVRDPTGPGWPPTWLLPTAELVAHRHDFNGCYAPAWPPPRRLAFGAHNPFHQIGKAAPNPTHDPKSSLPSQFFYIPNFTESLPRRHPQWPLNPASVENKERIGNIPE